MLCGAEVPYISHVASDNALLSCCRSSYTTSSAAEMGVPLQSMVRASPGRRSHATSAISFGMCLNLMSWVQQVHNAAVVGLSGVNVTLRYQQEGLSLKRESVGTPSTLRDRVGIKESRREKEVS